MRRLAALLTLLAGSAAAGTGDFVADRLALPPITLTDQHGAPPYLAGQLAVRGSGGFAFGLPCMAEPPSQRPSDP